MIEKIVAYGCSFIYGDGVARTNAWPELLGKKLNVPVRNRGVNGASNKLSLTYLIDDMSKEDYSNTLVIIGWTGIQRTSFWHEIDTYWIPVLPSYLPKDRNLADMTKFYYANMYSDFDALSTFYQQQILTQALLKQKNIQYMFVNAFREDYILYHDENLQRMIDMVDHTKFLFGYHESIYNLVCLKEKMMIEDNFHPNESGHEFIANAALEFLNK